MGDERGLRCTATTPGRAPFPRRPAPWPAGGGTASARAEYTSNPKWGQSYSRRDLPAALSANPALATRKHFTCLNRERLFSSSIRAVQWWGDGAAGAWRPCDRVTALPRPASAGPPRRSAGAARGGRLEADSADLPRGGL